MSQDSRIIYNGFDNSQDFWSNNNQRDDNDYKYNTFLSKYFWSDTNMNIQSSPTLLNNNFWDPFDVKFPDTLSNHSLLSKKIKRDEDEDSENPFKNDRLISDLEEEEEEEKGSNNKISENGSVNQPSDSPLDKHNKSPIVDKINYPYPTEKEVKEIIKCFLTAFVIFKDFNQFLNTPWATILVIFHTFLFSKIPTKLLETCPKDYIEEILNEEKPPKEKELIPISLQDLKNILESEMKENKKDKKNYKTFQLLEFSHIPHDNSSFNSEDYKINVECNRNNRFNLDNRFNFADNKETKNETNITIETNIENRIDNLFDRFKSMIQKYFIDMLNTKVKKENKLPEEINNYLVKIRGKEDNIKFLENNFIDNFTFFGKDSAQYQSILEIIERIYQNQAQNEEAIELLEKPTQNFISEIMSNKEMRQKFFEEDREMKIKEVKNDKCKIIAQKIKDQEILKGYIKINKSKNENNYIVIKDVEKFIKRVKKIKGYENYDLDFTSNENEKIDERTLILENIADNPMLYLKLIKGRLPRNKVKKGKKIGKKILFSVKK